MSHPNPKQQTANAAPGNIWNQSTPNKHNKNATTKSSNKNKKERHMVTKCPHCNAAEIVENKNGELVCIECATVLGPVVELPRRGLSKREVALAILYRYA